MKVCFADPLFWELMIFKRPEIFIFKHFQELQDIIIMALQLRQSLSLTQQLIMTPQLQRAIKLLQLSRLELLDTLYQEMEQNPMLEEQGMDEVDEEKGLEEGRDNSEQVVSEVTVKENVREDVDWENYLSEYNTGWAYAPYEEKDSLSFENFTAQKTNLYSHLLWQLNMSNVNEIQKEISIHIIGNLDDDGYLKISIEELIQITGYPQNEVLETLSLIQRFDPVGVAARGHPGMPADPGQISRFRGNPR
jgi:RNA polymerase sigma-54 factor